MVEVHWDHSVHDPRIKPETDEDSLESVPEKSRKHLQELHKELKSGTLDELLGKTSRLEAIRQARVVERMERQRKDLSELLSFLKNFLADFLPEEEIAHSVSIADVLKVLEKTPENPDSKNFARYISGLIFSEHLVTTMNLPQFMSFLNKRINALTKKINHPE